MNNTIKHLSNGDFEVLPMDEYSGLPAPDAYEDRVTELDDPERIEFERKRNYTYGTTEWDNWKPID